MFLISGITDLFLEGVAGIIASGMTPGCFSSPKLISGAVKDREGLFLVTESWKGVSGGGGGHD